MLRHAVYTTAETAALKEKNNSWYLSIAITNYAL